MSEQGDAGYSDLLEAAAALLKDVEGGQRGQILVDTARSISAQLRKRISKQPELVADEKAGELGMAWSNLGRVWLGMDLHNESLQAWQEAVDQYRTAFGARSEANAKSLASSIHNLGAALSELGRFEEGLQCAREAVSLYRHLHDVQPEDFAQFLASSLHKLSADLSNIGRDEEALQADQETVAYFRSLRQATPELYAEHLACSLRDLGISLLALGRVDEAMKVDQEAVDQYRWLHRARPQDFASDLASSLHNFGVHLSRLGRNEEALQSYQEALDLYRALHHYQPDAYAPDLAQALGSLGRALSALGRHDDARDATQRSVVLYRSLHSLQPDHFALLLANVLNDMGNVLNALGHCDDALQVTEEAVQRCRDLHRDRPDNFAVALEASLCNFGNLLSAKGRHDEALRVIEEFLGLRRAAVHQAGPQAVRADLAQGLRILAASLDSLGRCEEALQAIQDAVAICRTLILTSPGDMASELALNLYLLGALLTKQGHREEALQATSEAVDLYRTLYHASPADFAHPLILSLDTLCAALSAQGHGEEAMQAKQEVVALRRAFHRVGSEDSVRDLARSLSELGDMLTERGCHEQALQTSEEVVQLCRAMHGVRPEAFAEDLAKNLFILSASLGLSGRREEALKRAQEATDLFRMLHAAHSDAFARKLAIGLSSLGNCFRALGQRKEALDAIDEGVELYRALHLAGAHDVARELASELRDLGELLYELGHHEQALQACDEGVQLFRTLHGFRPEATARDLGRSLLILSDVLSAKDRREEALEATGEALEMFFTCHSDESVDDVHDLAEGLRSLCHRFDELGLPEKALQTCEEEVALWGLLNSALPDAFASDLAGGFSRLSILRRKLGRFEEALRAAQDAAQAYGTLYHADPECFASAFAGSLHNLGISLSSFGRNDEAVKVAQDAVRLYRALPIGSSEAFAADLAMSIDHLGCLLSALDRDDEALEVACESVVLHRALCDNRPGGISSGLAMSLNNYGNKLSRLGRNEEALQTIREAVQLYRALHRERPGEFAHQLADSLFNLGAQLKQMDHYEEALQITPKRLDLHRLLHPHVPQLAISFNNLIGPRYRVVGRLLESVEAHQEALDLCRDLHRACPEAFAHNLASSLSNLCACYSELGRHGEVQPLLAEAGRTLATSHIVHPALWRSLLLQSLPGVLSPEDLLAVHLRLLTRVVDLRAAVGLYGDTARETFTSLQATLVADLWRKLPAAEQASPGFMDEALPHLVTALQSPDLARMLANLARGTSEGEALYQAGMQLMHAEDDWRALMERLPRPDGNAGDVPAPGSSLRGASLPSAYQDLLNAGQQRLQAARAAYEAAGEALAAHNPDFAAAYLAPTTEELHQMLQALRLHSAPQRATADAPAALLCMMDIPDDGGAPGEVAPRRLVGMLVHSERAAALPVSFDGLHAVAQECQDFRIAGERSSASLRRAEAALPDAVAANAPLQRSLAQILDDVRRLWWQPLAAVLAREGVSLGSLHLCSNGVAHHLPFATVLTQVAGENTALHQWPGLPYLRAAYARRELDAAPPVGGVALPGHGSWQIGHDCAWDDATPLPMVALEAHWLRGLAAERGRAALSARSLDDLQPGGQVIAVCAHGVGSGSQSGVRLGDFRLDAAQVMRRRLAADLVLLPTCLGGFTLDDLGGNAMGLAAGFLFAGSGAVVASSKKVPDTLMPWFSTLVAWHVLHGGMFPHQAAHRARREMADGGLVDDPVLEGYRAWMRSAFPGALALLQPGGAEYAGLQACLPRQRAEALRAARAERARGKPLLQPPPDTLQRLEENWPWQGWQSGALVHQDPAVREDDTATATEQLFCPHGPPARREHFAQQMRELATFIVIYGLG